jgi:hypothetical protein
VLASRPSNAIVKQVPAIALSVHIGRLRTHAGSPEARLSPPRRRLSLMSAESTCERWENRTGLIFAIDNHIVDGKTPAELKLKRLNKDGWIQLVLTDVTRTEWKTAQPRTRQRLEELAIDYVEYWGPLTLDQSRLGSAKLGSCEDQERLERVFGVLFPGHELKTGNTQDVRDAMHVALAIRYSINGFITRDGIGKDKGILDRAEAIKATFDNFSIMTPERALALADRMIRGVRIAQGGARVGSWGSS